MEYIIALHKSPQELQIAVNNAIGAGWKPQGGVCVDSTAGFDRYYQAMIKE